MATEGDLRRIAMSLPGVDERPGYGKRPSWKVANNGFVGVRKDEASAVFPAEGSPSRLRPISSSGSTRRAGRLAGITAPVLVVSGCSGVGKSTVSRLLVSALSPAVHVPTDDICLWFGDPFPDPASPQGAHFYEVVGAASGAAAAQFARGAYTVVTDGFTRPDGATDLADRLGQRGIEVHYALLHADLTTCLERARRRTPERPLDADRFRATHARFAEMAESDNRVIDASLAPHEVANSVSSAFRDRRLTVV